MPNIIVHHRSFCRVMIITIITLAICVFQVVDRNTFHQCKIYCMHHYYKISSVIFLYYHLYEWGRIINYFVWIGGESGWIVMKCYLLYLHIINYYRHQITKWVHYKTEKTNGPARLRWHITPRHKHRIDQYMILPVI